MAAAGAVGALIYDNVDEDILTPEALALAASIPLAATTLALGTTINGWITKKQYNVTVQVVPLAVSACVGGGSRTAAACIPYHV